MLIINAPSSDTLSNVLFSLHRLLWPVCVPVRWRGAGAGMGLGTPRRRGRRPGPLCALGCCCRARLALTMLIKGLYTCSLSLEVFAAYQPAVRLAALFLVQTLPLP